jgi:hypothetical protein
MRKSYSKIRHIQESNEKLENRFLIKEEDQTKSALSNSLTSNGFVWQKYAEEWIYQNVNNFSIFIKPTGDGKNEVLVVMGDPAENMTKKKWTQEKGNLNDHPWTKMEQILGKEGKLDHSHELLEIGPVVVDDSRVKMIIPELNRLKPYIGNKTGDPYK